MLVFVKSWRGHASYRMWKVLGVVYLLTMCTLAIAGRKHYTVRGRKDTLKQFSGIQSM